MRVLFMMNLNTRVKSAILALSMITFSNSFCAVELPPFFKNLGTSLIANQKHIAISSLAIFLMALKVRLDTKATTKYSYDNWQQDVTDLLNAYNIFDAESRATIRAFVDKYLVGTKFKKEKTKTKQPKSEDGSEITLDGCKVVQKPSGAMGLVDAYVFMQAEGLIKLVPTLAGLYLLIGDPLGMRPKAVVEVKADK